VANYNDQAVIDSGKLFGIDYKKKYRTLAEIKILFPKPNLDKIRKKFL